jgi:arylsulfatase A-like enzyme
MTDFGDLDRRDLIKAGLTGLSLASLGLSGAVGDDERPRRGKDKRDDQRDDDRPEAEDEHDRGRRRLPRNVLILCTDQDRGIQHFPPNWAERNLPGLMRLKKHGLTFENAFTNSCMCSPARVTWMTGYFPAQHKVFSTLEESMPSDQYPQDEMPVDLPNMATVMTAAGFHSIYKGKWHCSKPINGTEFTQADLAQYGFDRWNPPDGGANQTVDEGGGAPSRPGAHDERFMFSDGPNEESAEGILAFLKSDLAKQQPFFMVASLVNPHDVLAYPTNYQAFGYTDEFLQGEIELPATVNEDLSTKPSAQQQFLVDSAGLGPLPTPEMKRNYVNFYGNLMKLSDQYIGRILDTLQEQGLLEDTLIIRTADHGEMGMTHGGQRQKNFNFYEESLRVPLVYSNPRLYPKPQSTKALVSHVDFVPTLASLYDAPKAARAEWQGVDYSRVILDPSSKGPQDNIVFTFDDYLSGQPTNIYPRPNNRIVSVREARYKLAEYYDPNGVATSEWEMYDLADDPLETNNLARPGYQRTATEQHHYERLQKKLEKTKRTRLQPLA